MTWPGTVWTEARQITALLGWDRVDGDEAAPARFYQALRAGNRASDAAFFLGSALPRLEAVRWSRQVIAQCRPGDEAPALAIIDRWIGARTDALRREVFDTTASLPAGDPVRLCAAAVFLSGGSIGTETGPPLPGPKHVTGQLAAAAVLACSSQSHDPDAALTEALRLGEALAVQSGNRIG